MWLFAVGVLWFLAMGGFAATAHPATSATLTLEPLNSTVLVGNVTTLDIVVQGVDGLYGIQLDLSYEAGKVEALEISPGACPSPDYGVQNAIDNTAGTASFAVTSLKPTLACSGEGVVASITFLAVGEGESPLLLTDWILADASGEPILVASQDGTLVVARPRVFLPLIVR